ncbi:9864_t:CDS:10 [Diversispora eburnea]|uniref:9864_t:CDS:1 n=1 Tax=Diversispora eburnea TaxID=1213867 RepID=A0A9N8YHY4_9GLOM|nr:9864_t:CDS:10 [Diversispora eburnea]
MSGKEFGLENQEHALQESEDLEDGTEIDSEDLLAAMTENSTEHQFVDVAPEEMEEELLEDGSLSPLEKIFLVYIARELPSLIKDIEISEAVEFVLPLMNSLGNDNEVHVREAFAPEVDKIIWFYYSHCPLKEATPENVHDGVFLTRRSLSPERPQTPQQRPPRPQTPQRPQTPIQQSLPLLPPQPQTPTSHLPYLSPSAFTGLLHTLLLDQNTGIAQSAQNAVQSLVEKILGDPNLSPKNKEILEKETLEGVVLGIGRLDQEKTKRTELNDWDTDGDDSNTHVVAGGEEIAELGRMTMMSLIASLASIVGPEKCTRLFLHELDKMATEPVFYVRKEAALAVGSLANVMSLDIITSKLLPLYDQFSNDPIWHVRRSCCLVLPTICSRLPEEMKFERAVKGMDLFAGDVCRSVRSAAGEMVGELIATFQPGGKVPESLIQNFLSLVPIREGSNGSNGVTGGSFSGGLGQQRDPERPVICAYNFPAVVLTLGESRWDDLKGTYVSLARDMQIKVRRSLACSLHEIAKVIGPTKTKEDLLNVFSLYLIDAEEVKSGLIEHLAAFIECLPQSNRDEYLPTLNDVWEGVSDQWRLRNEIAKQISELCRLFDEQNVINHILPLTIKAIKDSVATVRETAVTSFPALFEVLRNNESCLQKLINRMNEFVSDKGFRGRVVLANLLLDKVVNVRIALGRLVGELCRTEQYYQDPENRPSLTVDMIHCLAKDQDVDVRGFVFSILSPEDKSKFLSSEIQAMAESVENDIDPTTNNLDHAEVRKNIQESIETPLLKTEEIVKETIDEPRDAENGSPLGMIMGEIPIAFIRPNIEVDNNMSSSGLRVSSPPPT